MASEEASTARTSYWQPQIEAWRISGQTQKVYCKANDLNYHRFSYWKRKFLDQDNQVQRERSAGFVPVTRRLQAETSHLSLVLPNGLVLQGIASDNLPVVYQLLSQLS